MINNCDFQKLKEVIVSVLSVHPDEIKMDSRFCEDLGADSLDMYQMAMEAEKTFQLDLSSMDLESVKTVEDAINMCMQAKAK